MRNTTARLSAFCFGLVFSTSAMADLAPYSQDFEGLVAGDAGALSANGWLIFGNVFHGVTNAYLYGYGPFGAPNHAAAFSQIATGEQGPNQGQQYLNVFSDYNNGDHGNGHRIESNVFQEQVVGAVDLGQIASFNFDYKASSTAGPGGSTTALAFIKVLDPGAGYSLVGFETLDTTAASTSTWSEGNLLDITIDSAWTGHILQFGFLSNATLFEPSGVYYDNVSFSTAPVPEPATMALIAGAAGLMMRRRRKA